MNRGSVLVVLILASGCGHRVQTKLPSGPQHEFLYRQGLQAFRQATPEAYKQAIDSFRKASLLAPSRCEYSLHLAESLIFLAREQEYNWEEFDPRTSEAGQILDTLSHASECATFEPFVDRLRALSGPRREAVDLIDRAIALDPSDAMNWYVRWRLNVSNFEDAIVRAAELAPDLPLIQYELGNYRSLRGEYLEAKQAFERALEGSPRHFRSMIGLAYAIDSIDFNPAVERLYRMAINIAPTFLDGHVRLGDYYADLGETEQAVAEYQAAIASNSNYDHAYLTLGITLLEAGRLEEAQESLLSVVKLSPASSQAHYFLGRIWFARGDLSKAKAEYQEAIKYQLNYPDAEYALGVVFYQEGEMDEALTAFDKALTINPQHPDAYLSRGGIRAQRRQFVGAVNDETRAIEIYQRQISELEREAQKSESIGLTRKAEAERKRVHFIEDGLQRALAFKTQAEEDAR